MKNTSGADASADEKNASGKKTNAKSVIPPHVLQIMYKLRGAGFETWCVGGCVRDTLLGHTPHDWDVATEALPEQVMELFRRRAIPTGLKHGTLTILASPDRVEVTTFRCDGVYLDHRRPSSVTFTCSLYEDLHRRDFTVNAMAMGPDGSIQDPFDGQSDLRAGILRCVGSPDERFGEDALRIMRGLRFAAVLGFSLDPSTAESIHRNRETLCEIAPERIQMELFRLLCGVHATDILRQFPDVICVFWPEIRDMIGFEQHNPWHRFDVWEHTLHAMDAVEPQNLPLRCTMLLHDIGKPRAFTLDAKGIGHFYAHGTIGRDLADDMLRRLRCSNAFRTQVVRLVEWHDREIVPTGKAVRRALAALGEDTLRLLLTVKRADNLAQTEFTQAAEQSRLDEIQAISDGLIAKQSCFSLKQLAVNGRDIAKLGIQGKAIGMTLNTLLTRVVEEELSNERDVLLSAARDWKAQRESPS